MAALGSTQLRSAPELAPTEQQVKQVFEEAASRTNTFARTVLDEDFMPQTAQQYEQYTKLGTRSRPAFVHIPEEHAYILIGNAKLIQRLSQYSTALFTASYAPKEVALRLSLDYGAMYISAQRIGEYTRDITHVPELQSTLASQTKWRAAKIFPQYNEKTQLILRGALLDEGAAPYSLSSIKCSHVKLVRDQLINWIANSQCPLQAQLHAPDTITSRAMITFGQDHIPVHPCNNPSFLDEFSKYLGLFREASGGTDAGQARWALKSDLLLHKVRLFTPATESFVDGELFLPDMRILPAVQCFVDDEEQFTHAFTMSVIAYVQSSLEWQLSLEPCFRLKNAADATASDDQIRAALEIVAKLQSQ